MNEVNYNEFSYENLKNITSNFRKVSSDPFRKYDEPGFFFWKPLFYFYNGDDENYGLGSSGLLHPSWAKADENYDNITIDDTSDKNPEMTLTKEP